MAPPLGQGNSMPSLDDCPQTTPPNPSRASGLPRNWWLLCVGITGWLQLECPAALRRNRHHGFFPPPDKKLNIHGVRHPPRQHLARRPIHYRNQIQEASPHRNEG